MHFESDIAALEAKTKVTGAPLQFGALCREVFQTAEGQRLLALLCTVRHPLDHSFRADARLSAQEAGQREVIAALWRHGAALNSVPEIQTLPPETKTP
jgi:hypothetical protein